MEGTCVCYIHSFRIGLRNGKVLLSLGNSFVAYELLHTRYGFVYTPIDDVDLDIHLNFDSKFIQFLEKYVGRPPSYAYDVNKSYKRRIPMLMNSLSSFH